MKRKRDEDQPGVAGPGIPASTTTAAAASAKATTPGSGDTAGDAGAASDKVAPGQQQSQHPPGTAGAQQAQQDQPQQNLHIEEVTTGTMSDIEDGAPPPPKARRTMIQGQVVEPESEIGHEEEGDQGHADQHAAVQTASGDQPTGQQQQQEQGQAAGEQEARVQVEEVSEQPGVEQATGPEPGQPARRPSSAHQAEAPTAQPSLRAAVAAATLTTLSAQDPPPTGSPPAAAASPAAGATPAGDATRGGQGGKAAERPSGITDATPPEGRNGAQIPGITGGFCTPDAPRKGPLATHGVVVQEVVTDEEDMDEDAAQDRMEAEGDGKGQGGEGEQRQQGRQGGLQSRVERGGGPGGPTGSGAMTGRGTAAPPEAKGGVRPTAFTHPASAELHPGKGVAGEEEGKGPASVPGPVQQARAGQQEGGVASQDATTANLQGPRQTRGQGPAAATATVATSPAAAAIGAPSRGAPQPAGVVSGVEPSASANATGAAATPKKHAPLAPVAPGGTPAVQGQKVLCVVSSLALF
jgi:hypothetical protein